VIFCHHLGSSNDASALRPLLARMIDSASTLLADELSEPLKVPQDWWELVTQVTNTLSRLSTWAIRHQRRWIWVLDGLDKLDLDDQQTLPWLPLVLPEGVYLVSSALDCPIRTLLQERIDATLTIGPLGEAEREQLIQKYLSLYTKELVPALRQKITSHRQGSSPLFLRVLLEELRLCGKFETLAEQLQGYLTAESVADLYELVLQRLEDDGHGDAVQKVMTALWASRAGLSENELLAITGLVHAQWAPIGIGLQEALGEANGRLVFGHDFLRIAVQDRYLPSKEARRQAHSDLAVWHEAKKGWDERKAEELPWQLQKAERIDDLRNLLFNLGDLFELAKQRDERELVNYWLATKDEGDGELDELIADQLNEEIEMRRKNPENLIWFLNLIADLLFEAGLHRKVALKLRKLSLELEEASGERSEEAMLISMANYAKVVRSTGDLELSSSLYQRCLEASERLLGPVDSFTITMACELGVAYRDKGDHEHAESLLTRCLQTSQYLLGDHPQTLHCMAELALLCQDKGDYEQAESLQTLCLEKSESLLGPEHPQTLCRVNNIAVLYHLIGNHEKAVAYYLRGLKVSQLILGQEHPDSLIKESNLASLYRDIGDYVQAEALYTHCMEASERLLGTEHPDTNNRRDLLANLLSDQARYNEAIPLRRLELEIATKHDERDTESTLISVHKLGLDLYRNDELTESEQLLRQALSGRSAILGDQDGATMASRYALANSLSALERYEEAIELRRIELAWCCKENGDRDAGTLASISSLADDLIANGDPESAEELYRECLAGRIATLGVEHPATMASRYGLARCLSAMQRYSEAIELRRVELAWCLADKGVEAADMLTSVHGLGCDLLAAEQPEEALEVLQECLQQRRKLLGPCDDATLETHFRLLEVLLALERYENALVLSQALVQELIKERGENDSDVLVELTNQARLHEWLDQFDAAEVLSRKSLSGYETSLGLDHPDTLSAALSLARVLSAQNRHLEAIPLRRRELDWCQEHNGESDPGTLESLNQLAVDLREVGELVEAEALFRNLVAVQQEVHEPGDFEICRALGGLAKTLEAAGKLEEALDNAQQCLNHRLEYEGPDSFYTNRNRFDVARVLHKLERDPEALLLLNQLDASLNSESELSDVEQQLLADATALRAAIKGDSA
jgi:hypothetical protein